MKKDKLVPHSDEEEARIQAGIALDPDNPEWTAEDFAKARPFAEMFPELLANMRRARGRPPVEDPKVKVTIRLPADVIAAYKADGPGWQTRISETLSKAVNENRTGKAKRRAG